jgi:hypothetical protein
LEQSKLPADHRLRRLIEAAVRAPSGDNCQPWQFHFDGEHRLIIEFLPERAKSFFDFSYCGTLISVGAIIENIRIQAASDGLAIDVSYLEGKEPGNPAATLELRPDPGASVPPSRRDAMLQRTVTRRPFWPKRVARQKLDAVLANPVEGTDVRVIESRREIAQWARLIYLADRIRYTHPIIHEELFSKIQFTRADAQRTRLGLEIDRLGAGPAAGMIMRFLKPWPRTQRLQKIGIDRGLSGHSRFLTLASGALVLVTIPASAPRDWIVAGEQIERLWVQAQEQGLCVHPMTVVLYLAQRYREEGPEAFLPQHIPLLEKIQAGLDGLLGDRAGAMIFRLGYGWHMKTTAVRMPVDSLMRGE